MSPDSESNSERISDEEQALMRALSDEFERVAGEENLGGLDSSDVLSRFFEIRNAFGVAEEEYYPGAEREKQQEEILRAEFPGYTITEEVGRGGFGVVYRAKDEKLGREVALKLLLPQRQLSEDSRARFLEEARALASVRHRNVLTIHSVLEHGDQIALVTELIEGETLCDLVETKGPLSARETVAIGTEICHALAAVHAAGLVHRDVKTTNVLRERGGRLVLTDFGLGVFAGGQKERGKEGPAGSPLFMAPEQVRGRSADARTDIYALGVVLYYLLTAQFPFDGDSAIALFEQIEAGRGRSLRDVRPDLPESLVRIVGKAVAVDPGERFQTAGEFEEALLAVLDAPGAQGVGRSTGEGAEREGSPAGEGARAEDRPANQDQPARRLRKRRYLVPGLALAGAALLVLAVFSSDFLLESLFPKPIAVKIAELRLDGVEARRPLKANDRITGGRDGDAVYLEFEAEQDVYVYVLNEDDQGSRFLLFPLPGGQDQNPLSAGEQYELPGKLWGEAHTWGFSEDGGSEKVFVLASLEPLQPLEDAGRKSTNELGLGYPKVSDAAVLALRGMSILHKARKGDRAIDGGSLERVIAGLTEAPELKGKVWQKKYVLEKR